MIRGLTVANNIGTNEAGGPVDVISDGDRFQRDSPFNSLPAVG
jgi:hypothetical protein